MRKLFTTRKKNRGIKNRQAFSCGKMEIHNRNKVDPIKKTMINVQYSKLLIAIKNRKKKNKKMNKNKNDIQQEKRFSRIHTFYLSFY